MTIDLAADRAIAAAETLLDTCTITRAAATAPVWDPVTRTHTAAAPSVVWSGACSVSTMTGRVLNRGGVDAIAYTHQVRVPHTDGPTTVLPGDVVTVSAVRDGGNTALDGLELIVVEVPEQSTTVLRRLGCTRLVDTTVPL